MSDLGLDASNALVQSSGCLLREFQKIRDHPCWVCSAWTLRFVFRTVGVYTQTINRNTLKSKTLKPQSPS